MRSATTTEIRRLWSYRPLIIAIAVKDLKLRYKNSFLGFLWSLLEPLGTLAILYFVFTYIRIDRPENFMIFLFTGIVLWGMFARGTNAGMNSLVAKGRILSSTPIPLEIPVISSTITALMTFVLELIVFFIFMIVLQYIPPASIALIIPLVLLEAVLVLGVSLILSVLNVFHRDMKYIWGLAVHAGFFVSGIFFDINRFPEEIKFWMFHNPMAGIISMGHTMVFGTVPPPIYAIIYAIAISFGMLAAGYAVFRHYSPRVIEEL